MKNTMFQPNEKIRAKSNIPNTRLWLDRETLREQTGCCESDIVEIEEGSIEEPTFSIGHENEIAKWTWDNAELAEDDVLSPNPGSKVGSRVFCLGDKTILAIKTPKRIVLKFFNRAAHDADKLYDSNLYDLWVYEENDPAFAA